MYYFYFLAMVYTCAKQKYVFTFNARAPLTTERQETELKFEKNYRIYLCK